MTDDPVRRKRPRSPSYPGLSLEEAVGKARAIYAKEGRHLVAQAAILDDMGYTSRSGASNVAIASLRKYGLLIYEGQNARLSDLALKIIWDEEGSPEGRAALQEAALKPTLHSSLWEQYRGRLPSDAALRLELRQRGFADTAIPGAIRVLRSTVEYAELTGADKVEDKEGDSLSLPSDEEAEVPETTVELPLRTQPPGAPSPIQLPLLGGTVVTLKASGPVSEQAWDQMMAVFTALKPGFVTAADGTPVERPESD